MVSSVRKTTAANCTRPVASLTSASRYRWLLHEGEWVRAFRPVQQRMRWTGGGAHRQTEVAVESEGQSEQGGTNAEEAEREKPRPGVHLL
jgi:hypothetical protein